MFLFDSSINDFKCKSTGFQALLLILHVGFIFFFTPVDVSAQNKKHDQVWVFARNTRLDFSTIPPTVSFIKAPVQDISYGYTGMCSSVSDSIGNLQFYFNRIGDIYFTNIGLRDKFGGVLLGASSLFEADNTESSLQILPDLMESSKYWCVYIPPSYFGSSNSELQLSLIEMRGNGGLGAVVPPKIFPLGGIKLEPSFDAIPNASGNDWWILVRSRSIAEFRVLKLNNGNTFINDVSSINYPLYTRSDGCNMIAGRSIKFSNNGTKFLYVLSTGDLVVGDFDRCAGKISNLRILSTGLMVPIKQDPMYLSDGTANDWFDGIAISESDSILYLNIYLQLHQIVLDKSWSRVHQVQLLADITNNRRNYYFSSVEKGPDNKIYMSKIIHDNDTRKVPASDTFASFLAVVNNPNVIGQGCDFQLNGLELPDTQYTEGPLPSMPIFRPGPYRSSKLRQVHIPEHSVTRCIGDTVTIGLSATNGLIYRWIPPDGLNDATIPNPTLTISTPQNYVVSITDTSSPCTPTIYDTIQVTLRPESECKSTFVFIPNAFTPNGDGINDIWQVNFSVDVLRTQALIFNRWGQEVFRGDPRTGWDGTRASEGVYTYSLSWTDKEGKHARNGNITLLR